MSESPGVARRTLVRRLSLMTQLGRLVKSGRGRATRYRLVAPKCEPLVGVDVLATTVVRAGADPLPEFIQLGRRFSEYDVERPREHDDWTFTFSSEFQAPHTWEEVLTHRATVVVAEAGTGKSTELRQKTLELRANGKAAFFCRLEDLAISPITRALEIGTPEELSSWLEGNEDGWFFLDSVDEAKLIDSRHFHRAIAEFAETISAHWHRLHVILSTRPHAWGRYDEREMLCRWLRLCLKEEQERGAEANENAEPDWEPTSEVVEADSSASEAKNKPAKRPVLHEWQLAPLDATQIRRFAEAHGLDDVEAFLAELERANADVFANRPEDLRGLIELWRSKKRFGSYSEVVFSNVRLKLGETNPRRQHAAELTPDRAVCGAERLAAAVTFTRKTSIRLPDGEVDPKVRGEVLDPRDVLLDWRPAEIQELLGRALFDESLYGTVRFHHRTAREYMTARWLSRLLGQRKHRRSVQDILFVCPYGTEMPVVRPSVKPIAAWLSVWDPDIHDRVLRIDPKVLLEFGDAGSLRPETRSALLKHFARRYASQKHTPLSLHVREVCRLADPTLVGTVRELLVEYRDHDDVRKLLLRVVREGKLEGCGDLVLGFATDAVIKDNYTRTCAIQAIRAVGTQDEKALLKKAICGNLARENRAILAAGMEALFPAHLSVAEVLGIVEAAPTEDEDTIDILHFTLERLVKGLKEPIDQLELLEGLTALLQRAPLKSKWCPISLRYAGLLQSTYPLAIALVARRPDGPFDTAAVTVLRMAIQSRYLTMHVGHARKDALEVINDNHSLRHSLFWHEAAEMRRREPDERVTDWFRVRLDPHIRSFDEGDIATLLKALEVRPELDDKLVALSALMWICGTNERQERILLAIEAAVKGTMELEEAFAGYMKPKESNQECEDDGDDAPLAEVERQTAEARAWLRANVDKLEVDDHAMKGDVLHAVLDLHHEIWKVGKHGTHWTVSNWERLIPDFGEEVARAFRDYCIGYWRRYEPNLRSEIVGETNSTPQAIIIGLAGLAMEAAVDPLWATKLKSAEAARAVRYALWELNEFPPWLTPLASDRPEAVLPVLLREIVWELTHKMPNDRSYVLARLSWSGKSLGQMLRLQIAELLNQHHVANAQALEEALRLLLGNPAPLPQEFIATVARHTDAAADDRLKALWLAALLCLDARRALPLLERWVASTPDQAEHRISLVLNHAWGERLHGLNPQHQTFRDAKILLRLIKLSHTHIRLEADLRHRGIYSPGERDHAQDARDRLLNILCELPGRATYEALLELSEFHPQQYPKDRVLVLAERRAEMDVEKPAWDPRDVAAFAADADYAPRTPQDLFQLARWRLDDLKLELEEGDESEASVLQRVENEPELRRVIANRLRQAAAGKYTTGSEEELADMSRTDIRLHHPAVETRIPIEVKIADKDGWSASVLRERLEKQLIGQYLRESRYGIFLLVQRGNQLLGDKGGWRIPGRSGTMGFGELIEWLDIEATELRRVRPGLDGVAVVGIDLTRRKNKKAAI